MRKPLIPCTLIQHFLRLVAGLCSTGILLAVSPNMSRADIPAPTAGPVAPYGGSVIPAPMLQESLLLVRAGAGKAEAAGVAADIPPKPSGEDKAQAKDTPVAPVKPFRPSFRVSGDFYFGATNATGVTARNNDAMWAGLQTFVPSNIALNWQGGENRNFRLSMGIGDMYTQKGTWLRQPIEAFYQTPMRGGNSITVGKFYVPFAQSGWEYESKSGAMIQGARGSLGYAASVNYNNLSRSANAYLRIGQQWKTGTAVGISAAGGRGVFYGTSQNAALGLDVAQELKGLRIGAEYNFATGAQGAFQFASGTLTFTNMGRFEPFVGAYYSRDEAGQQGNNRSFTSGFGYRISQNLALETGYARANNRNVFWFQSHTNF